MDYDSSQSPLPPSDKKFPIVLVVSIVLGIGVIAGVVALVAHMQLDLGNKALPESQATKTVAAHEELPPEHRAEPKVTPPVEMAAEPLETEDTSATHAAAAAAVPSLPRSTLPIFLLATFKAEPGNRSIALLNVEKQPSRVYELGDQILPGVNLRQVGSQRIVIVNRGTKEYIALDRQNLGEPTNDPALQEYAEPGLKLVGNNVTVSRKFLLTERKMHLALALQGADFVPFKRQGEMVGVQLAKVRANSLARKLGFQKGDAILSVNDHSLDDPTTFIQVVREFYKLVQLKVVLLRDGQEMTKLISVGGG